MKWIYDSYRDIWKYARGAVRDAFRGLFRIVWTIILLVVNSARFCFLWLSKMVSKKPMITLLVFTGLLLATNCVNYISMKAKLNTSEWRYDTFKLHTDSLMELYNVNKNYSRITSYE